MRLVIFSDIHGNAEALKGLLDQEPQRDNTCFIFCGDVAGYYYNTVECVDMLRQIDRLIAVRGNHDQYYIDSFTDTKLTDSLVKKYGLSYRIKDSEVFEFLKTLPLQKNAVLGGKKIRIQHGTPYDLMEGRLYPDSGINTEEKDAIFICGHTHYQMYKNEDSNIWINPGSLGQPRDGNGFSYCVFDLEKKKVSYKSVDVDIEKLVYQVQRYDPENVYLEHVLYRSKRG